MTETKPHRPGMLPSENSKGRRDPRVYWPCANREAITAWARKRGTDVYIHDGAFLDYNDQEFLDWVCGRPDLSEDLTIVLRSGDFDPDGDDESAIRGSIVANTPYRRVHALARDEVRGPALLLLLSATDVAASAGTIIGFTGEDKVWRFRPEPDKRDIYVPFSASSSPGDVVNKRVAPLNAYPVCSEAYAALLERVRGPYATRLLQELGLEPAPLDLNPITDWSSAFGIPFREPDVAEQELLDLIFSTRHKLHYDPYCHFFSAMYPASDD